ncbi:MAG: GUN4 N-terminal ARM-like repeat domain-containing protein [Hormoscilla sp. GUM202]|nr:GUN4 N-terminal ARM-like repeat domain-containing protein [Hormoscilla sp. GM7CHS1pb]MBO1349088.1 GUN4 N-terminal ARM-like repeat domain-containing protein [Hormoscilla sp. GUM202]
MSDQATSLASNPDLARLETQLRSGKAKTQLQSIPQLADAGADGTRLLMEFLRDRLPDSQPTPIDGKVYQTLLAASDTQVKEFLQADFPTGVVPLASDRDLDYTQLQQLLAKLDWQAADRLTNQKLCELAGARAVQRKWLYFTEVERFPITDLQTINSLWLVYSEGKFGFSVQRELWLSVGKNWDNLWPKIGWKSDNNWTRYPQEFTWDITAPRGHLPLSNQLRGVRVIASLLTHPAWDT